MDERSPRHDVVDEAVAVDVLHDGAGRTPNEERGPAYGLERAHGAVYATGQDLAGSQKELLATDGLFHDMRNSKFKMHDANAVCMLNCAF